jgi:hypothetical protein
VSIYSHVREYVCVWASGCVRLCLGICLLLYFPQGVMGQPARAHTWMCGCGAVHACACRCAFVVGWRREAQGAGLLRSCGQCLQSIFLRCGDPSKRRRSSGKRVLRNAHCTVMSLLWSASCLPAGDVHPYVPPQHLCQQDLKL